MEGRTKCLVNRLGSGSWLQARPDRDLPADAHTAPDLSVQWTGLFDTKYENQLLNLKSYFTTTELSKIDGAKWSSANFDPAQGLLVMPDGPAGFHVEVAGEYLLITLRQMPLTAEGVYRFLVSVGVDTEVTLDVPVLVVSNRGHAEIH